jgi:predicted GTPase
MQRSVSEEQFNAWDAGTKKLDECIDSVYRKLSALKDRCAAEGMAEHIQELLEFKRNCEIARQRTRTILVLGLSGCGKSTLLNSILDETDILPTANNGACTGKIIISSLNG